MAAIAVILCRWKSYRQIFCGFPAYSYYWHRSCFLSLVSSVIWATSQQGKTT